MPREAQPLNIVGASVRAAAQSAVRAGYDVWGADLFADADLCAIAKANAVSRYPAGLLKALADSPDAPWMYTGALENYPALIERISQLRPLWGNSADVVRRVRDPMVLAQALRSHDISFPRTIKADASQRGKRFEPDRWLVKPQRSGGGQHVAWFEDSRQLEQRGRWYLQQFISGIPCSAVYVAANCNAVLLGVTRQLIGESSLRGTGFHYCGSIGPISPMKWDKEKLDCIGNILAKEFSLLGLFGVDFLYSQGDMFVIEVNPRYTASIEILERSMNFSAVEMHAAACQTGGLPASDFHTSSMTRSPEVLAKRILFARQDATFHVKAAEHVRALNSNSHWPRVADIPHIDTPIVCGSPIVTLFFAAKYWSWADKELERVANEFEAELYG